MPEIRNLEPGDFRHLLVIETESFENGYSPYFIKMIPVLFGNTSFIAVKGKSALGYVVGAIEQANRRRAWIMSLAVRPRARQQGLGSKLVAAVLASLAQAGVREVKLTVSPGNSSAIELYQKHGFVVCREAEDYFGQGQHRLLMKKELCSIK